MFLCSLPEELLKKLTGLDQRINSKSQKLLEPCFNIIYKALILNESWTQDANPQ